MIKLVKNNKTLYLNPNHHQSFQLDSESGVITCYATSGELYSFDPSWDGYDNFLKLLDGFCLQVISTLDPLSSMPRGLIGVH